MSGDPAKDWDEGLHDVMRRMLYSSSCFTTPITISSNNDKELDDRPEVAELVKHVRDHRSEIREVQVIVASNARINADNLQAEGDGIALVSARGVISDAAIRISSGACGTRA
ncbi:hypothetical protein [Bradyrhizobium monzae]|uniref:hypothetical protein n=1 Tax=Bradyrhizobium sp. Oc8 TaxID=2876780 RepID=UPI001F1DC490|nr:hypothetical protein [Bradyrhizobium sp. Oc8]